MERRRVPRVSPSEAERIGVGAWINSTFIVGMITSAPAFGHRRWAIALCAIVGVYNAAYVLTSVFSDGTLGYRFGFFFSDFLVYYASGPALHVGGPSLVFDVDAFTKFQASLVTTNVASALRSRPWLYPPPALGVSALLSFLPFLASAIVVQIFGLLAFWVATGRKAWLLMAIVASPAFCATFIAGQNTTYVLACMIGGLQLLPTAPILAGVVLGLVSLKPHLFLLIPLGLVAAREWRSLTSCLLIAATSVLGSLVFPGLDAWRLWFKVSMAPLRLLSTEYLSLYGAQMGSVTSTVQLVGGTPTAAWICQLVAAAGAAIGLWYVFSRKTNFTTRLLALTSASLLAAPYWMNYDLLLVSAAATIAVLDSFSTGLRHGEGLTWLCVWGLPFPIMIFLNRAGFPISALVVAAVFVVTLLHAPRDGPGSGEPSA